MSFTSTEESYSFPGQSYKCDTSLASESTPTSGNKQDLITARSPYVKGSVHEECAWLTVEEARLKSPVFEQIYHTEQFRQLLNSILAPEEVAVAKVYD